MRRSTREAILCAAFTRAGYGGVGVREIAAAAGVNPSLVNRYFGSKEALFAEAVPATFGVECLLPEDRAGFAVALARYVLDKDKEALAGFDPTLAMLRSVGNPLAAGLMREGMEERFVGPLARRLGGPDAEARAGMVVAFLAGVAAMRDVLGLEALTEPGTGAERLTAMLLAALIEPRQGEGESAQERAGGRGQAARTNGAAAAQAGSPAHAGGGSTGRRRAT